MCNSNASAKREEFAVFITNPALPQGRAVEICRSVRIRTRFL